MILFDLLLHDLPQPEGLWPRSQFSRFKNHLQVPIFLLVNAALVLQLPGGRHLIVSILLVIDFPKEFLVMAEAHDFLLLVLLKLLILLEFMLQLHGT